VSVALCLASCAASCRNREGHAHRTQAEIEMDNRLNAKVRENLTANPGVRATDIGVSTLQLVVTLDGQVRSKAERALAIKIAQDTEVVGDGTPHRAKGVEAGGLTVKAP
jgi:osmotically-inducible protein OsmY